MFILIKTLNTPDNTMPMYQLTLGVNGRVFTVMTIIYYGTFSM